MKSARSASSIIWKTVVCAGAMLGSAACGGSTPPPKAAETETEPAPEVVAAPVDAAPEVIAEAPVEPGPPEPEPEPEPAVAQAPMELEVTSSPAGAEVYLDPATEALGKTPLTFIVQRSTEAQTVRFVKKGYVTKTVTITPDGRVKIVAPPAKKGEGQPSITFGPDAAGNVKFNVALVKVKKKKEKEERVRGSGEGGSGRGFVLS